MNPTDTKELWAALFSVQKQIEGVVKGEENSYFDSKYADRTTILKLLKPVMAEAGLLLIQSLVASQPEHLAMATTIVHVATGQAYSETATMPLSKVDPQGYGSAATYLSRYSLVALFALPLLDDDGNAASGKSERPARAPLGAGTAKRQQTTASKETKPTEPTSQASGTQPVTTAASAAGPASSTTAPTGTQSTSKGRKLWGSK